jgi:aminopeptidase YwaD
VLEQQSAVTSFERELRDRISGRRALGYIEQLVTFGDRFVGSKGDRAVADWIRGLYRDWGFDLEEREFSTFGYSHTKCELRLVGEGTVFEAIPPYFSPATPPDGVRGDLLFVGGGEEADYEGLDGEGKIVVIQETGLGYARFWMGTFAALAARRGAVAVIVIHPLPWPYRMSMEAGNGRLEARFCAEQIPVVSISAIDGGQLMRAIGENRLAAEIVVDCEMPTVTSWNISGTLVGRELPDERILVHAHRDHGIPPGANDNGSGLGTMLEVAGALQSAHPRRSIEFLCTTAEEGVTKGIAGYIESRRSERSLGQIRAAIDLDMIGTGGKTKLVEFGLWPDMDPVPHTEWLMQWVERLADQLGYDIGRMTATWGIAESARLLEAGVPAIWFWRPDDFYYHSAEDTVDKLDGNTLKAVADITAITLWQLAEADRLPAEA